METTTVTLGDKTSERATFPVQGMTCEGCSRTLSKALYALPGMEFVLIDRPNDRAIVQYDPTKVDAKTVVQTVEDAGYDVPA